MIKSLIVISVLIKNYKNMDDQGYKHQVFYANIGA
jgi:hypothetical protein